MEFWTGATGLFKSRAMPASAADGYDLYVNGAKEAEALGFHAYGAPEHHFMYDGFMPLPLQALAAAAAVTSKIRLVTGAMLMTLYEPLEAAEYAATVDVLSGGRVTLGLGMGYRPFEFDGIGTAKRTRGARLVEGMQILERALRGERFTFEGQHYRYVDAAVEPAPVQRPIPMWFCGGTSLVAARRAGTFGLPYWLANARFELIEAIIDEYHKAAAEAGVPEERLQVAAFKDICIGDTVAEAEMLRDMLLRSFYDEHILGYGYLVDDTGKHLYGLPADDPRYEAFAAGIFCGTPEMVIEELKRYETLGVEAVFVETPQRELLASSVMSEFRQGSQPARER